VHLLGAAGQVLVLPTPTPTPTPTTIPTPNQCTSLGQPGRCSCSSWSLCVRSVRPCCSTNS